MLNLVINMKRIKTICLSIISLILVVISCICVYAETIYEYYGYSYVIVDNKSLSLVGWDYRTPELIIPDSINGRSVTSIVSGAFEGNNELTALDFSKTNSLNRIGAYAFQDCNGINQPLVLSESITEIENRAFQGCSSIPSVTINSTVTTIPNQCFNNCTSLVNAELPEGVERINAWAFANCTSLEYVNIPSTVSFISDYAFNGDSTLTLGVWYGTAGYDYAIVQNIPYVLLDGIKLGDVSGDGSVNINDVTTIQRYLAELETLEGIYLHAADANQDGTVDISDATIIQMYLAEYEMEYPIGKVMTQ